MCWIPVGNEVTDSVAQVVSQLGLVTSAWSVTIRTSGGRHWCMAYELLQLGSKHAADFIQQCDADFVWANEMDILFAERMQTTVPVLPNLLRAASTTCVPYAVTTQSCSRKRKEHKGWSWKGQDCLVEAIASNRPRLKCRRIAQSRLP